jgi:hypothetical protein
MNGVLQSRGGGDDFAFLIFLIIAGIIQFINWLKKRSIQPVQPERSEPTAPPSSPPESASPEDGLKRILEELTGRKTAAPPPSPPPIPAPRRTPVSSPRPIPAGGADVYERTHGRKSLRWRIQLRKESEKKVAAPPPMPVYAPAPNLEPEFVPPPLPTMARSDFKSALTNSIRMVSFKFPSLQLPTVGMMRTDTSSQSKDALRRRLPLDIKTMRKAVMYRTILGPPVALQTQSDSNQA